MKTQSKKFALYLYGISWLSLLNVTAQTTQYVTLYTTNNPATFAVQTNQLVSIVRFSWASVGNPIVNQVFASASDGTQLNVTPLSSRTSASASISFFASQIPQTFTGMTNVTLSGAASSPGWVTLQVVTPSSGSVVSNYVPADAVVIPANTTGNVQIILESSSDLINWTAANPGIYDPSSVTNRFFRVRAALN